MKNDSAIYRGPILYRSPKCPMKRRVIAISIWSILTIWLLLACLEVIRRALTSDVEIWRTLLIFFAFIALIFCGNYLIIHHILYPHFIIHSKGITQERHHGIPISNCHNITRDIRRKFFRISRSIPDLIEWEMIVRFSKAPDRDRLSCVTLFLDRYNLYTRDYFRWVIGCPGKEGKTVIETISKHLRDHDIPEVPNTCTRCGVEYPLTGLCHRCDPGGAD